MSDVLLNVPARPDFLHVLRAVVYGVAARKGLSYDAIDDLGLAANEAAAYLLALPQIEGSDGRRLRVRIGTQDEVQVTVMIDASVTHWPPATRQSLAWRILSSLVDDVSFVFEDGCPAIRMVKGRAATGTPDGVLP